MKTLEEALSLEAGPDLDFVVLTKVMHWKPVYVPADAFLRKDSAGQLDYWIDEKGTSRPLGTSPSTDMACAWEVVENLRTICSARPSDHTCYNFAIRAAHHSWQASFQDWNPGDFSGYGMCSYEYAPTPMLAICRAALCIAFYAEDPSTANERFWQDNPYQAPQKS